MLKCAGKRIVALALLGGLAACGVKGPLEPPPGALSEQSSPKPDTGTSDKPHEPTILDGLL